MRRPPKKKHVVSETDSKSRSLALTLASRRLPNVAGSTGPGWCQSSSLRCAIRKNFAENASEPLSMRRMVAGFKNGAAPSVPIATPVPPINAVRPPSGE